MRAGTGMRCHDKHQGETREGGRGLAPWRQLETMHESGIEEVAEGKGGGGGLGWRREVELVIVACF